MFSRPSALHLIVTFLRLGSAAFGGPAMAAEVQELAVRRRARITEKEFAHGLARCQSIRGATATQLAAFIGLRLGCSPPLRGTAAYFPCVHIVLVVVGGTLPALLFF